MNGHTLFDELSDPNHPLRQREWNTFLERRRMLLDDISARIGLGIATQGMSFDVDSQEMIDALARQAAEERMRMADQIAATGNQPERMRQRDYQQVLGQALMYGVENPEEIPFGELQQMVEAARVRRRDEGDPGRDELFDRVALIGGSERSPEFGALTPAYVGSVDALVRTAETLPFLGNWISDRETTQEINRWIGALREAHTGAMDESELRGAVIQETLGGLVGYIAPGIGAWRLAGGLLGLARIGGVTRATQAIRGREIIQTPTKTWGLMSSNPILHRSIQGGLAATILESGGDGPIEEKALNIGLGTGLGLAFEVGGPVGAATFGGVAGGIVGASVDEPLVGALVGIGAGLGLNRAWRVYNRQSGLGESKFSSWQEPRDVEWARGFDALDQLMPGPSMNRPPAVRIPPNRLPSGPSPEAIGPVPARTALPGTPQVAGQLPSAGELTQAIDRFTFAGPRTLFYGGAETPEALVRRWGNLERTGEIPSTGLTDNILLDNTGRILPGAQHVHEVEANFEALFVVTPESAPILRNLASDAQTLPEIQTRLREVGFDGIAVQGIDDVVNQVGLDIAAETLGLPSTLLQDQVVAFGTPYQVKFSRPIIDGDLLDQAFQDFGSSAGRQVAGVQSATFSREAAKQLRPFEVGTQAEQLGLASGVPPWLSESRGVRFVKDPGADPSPLVPQEIHSAVLQHSPEFGPRVVLLNSDQVAKATIPVQSLEEGTETLARLGFQHMDPNSQEEAVRLAHQLSNAERFVNNDLADILGQVENPTATDLVAITHAATPGRLAVVSDIGDPFELRRNLGTVAERYGKVLDFDKDLMIVERPTGTFHAITGPPEMLTPKVREQFKEFGVFSGMEAGTTGGSSVRVNSVWREKSGRARASISPIFSDIKATVPLDYVIPGRTSVQHPLTGDVYKKFTNFALGRFNKEALGAGLDPATELADPRVLSFIDKYIEEFADSQGIQDSYGIGRFAGSLEWNLARDIQRIAGDDGRFFNEALRAQADELTAATLQGRIPLPGVEELAAAKGFVWEPPFRGRHGQLVDQNSNLVVPFDNLVSARAFLQNFHRDAPDLSVREGAHYHAFQGFDSHAVKPESGIEFPTEAAEIRSIEGTVRKAADDTDKLTDDLQKALDVMERLRAARATPETPPPFVPEGPTPPPTTPDGGEPPIPPLVPRPASPAPDPGEISSIVLRPQPRQARGELETMLEQMGRQFGADHPERTQALKSLLDGPFAITKLTAPVRIVGQIIDENLVQAGIDRPTIWRNIENIATGKVNANNAAAPWLKEARDLLLPFKRGDIRLGNLYDVMTVSSAPDANLHARTGFASQRDFLMDHYGFTPEMKQGVEALRDMFDRLHAEAADFADIGYIFDYLPRMKYFFDTYGDRGWRPWAESLPNELKWFALYARDGQLQSFQKDVGRVVDMYIRGLHFEKHVRAPFERAKVVADDPRTPEPLRDFLGNWLYVVRHGHPKGHDAGIRAMMEGFNFMSDISSKVFRTPRVHVTEGEVLNGLGMVATFQYRGLLGNSPRTNIREFYQPMLAAPEIGITRVLGSYGKFLKDPNVRDEWTRRALQHGWAEPNRVAVANADFFTGELRNVTGRTAFEPDVYAARELFAGIWDSVYDSLPRAAKTGIEGKPFLDPLWVYRKYATNPGRIIAGNAGYEHAMDAIIRYQAGDIDFAQLLRQSTAGQRGWSVRQEFVDKVNAGDFEGAATVIGGETAGTQFHFGIAEQSEAIRGAGIVGRLALQFGNFANQFLWRIARNTKNMDWQTKAGYWARLATLATIPGYVGAKVGWEEMKRFNWFRSLTFGGGTFVDPMLNIAHTNTAVRKIIAGDPLSPEERFAVSRFSDVSLGVPLNPYGSTIRTAQGYLDTLSDPNPAEAFFRMTLTGFSQGAATQRFLEGFGEQIHGAMEREGLGAVMPSPPAFEQLGITPEEWGQFLMALDSITESSGGGSRQ